MWVVLVLVAIQIAMFAFGLWWLRREDAGDEPGQGGGGPGSEPPEGPLPGDQPAWWPEFESEFATYVAGAEPQPTP